MTFDSSIYDADYFLRGKESGKSLYTDYRYLPELTVPMCQHIVDHLGAKKGQQILDFGCARGYTVKALRGLGYDAYGVDVSEWAIHNADEETKPYLNYPMSEFDWVIAKDVLEHVAELKETIDALMACARLGMFVVVPLSSEDGEPYVVADYEKDVTHLHRLSLATWARMFMRVGWRVEAMYRLMGVKDNYAVWENGNGFITARRIV